MFPILLPLLPLLLLPLVRSASLPPLDHDHSHTVQTSLPRTWFHSPDHPVHNLFKRYPPGDGGQYAPVGSPTWLAAYPASSPDVAALPKQWVDALNAAVAGGKIPDIPQSSGTPGQRPVYPQGTDPNNPAVCSGSYKCRNPDDYWDAPTGYFGTGFDDGPTPASIQLGQFLQYNNETATHFVIGVNVLRYPDQFRYIFDTLEHDIAVHTWTHPYMTTLDNLQVLAQLGWSMQLIHDSTGGRIPRFWRAPYGDADNRVQAIAKEVFGLRALYWNQDTRDWSLTTVNGTTMPIIADSFKTWLTGPKTPGLIVLEHELFNETVQTFIDAYPLMKANNWTLLSVARLADNGTVYRNAINGTSPVTATSIVLSFSTLTTTATTAGTGVASTTTAITAGASTTTTPPNAIPSSTRANTGTTSWRIHIPCVAAGIIAAIILADPIFR